MKKLEQFKYLLKKSPLVRYLTWSFSILFFIGFFAFIGRNVKRKPNITSINPTIGAPGEIMTIKGNGFGKQRNTSFVEISGSKITSSGYISWDDSEIQILIPTNVQDGLVFVGTSAGISEPDFFANKNGIPVAIRQDPLTNLPTIVSISATNVMIGQTITINGINFGSSRGNSRVLFTANRDENISFVDQPGKPSSENEFIQASSLNLDYELWSDTEIRVRIPDGADSGPILVQTNRGDSEPQKITVNFPSGKKQYLNRRTYVVQLGAEISNHTSTDDSSFTLYIPKPAISSFQPYAEINDYYPEPLIIDDDHDIIHQFQLTNLMNNSQRFSQTFVVSDYAVTSNLKSKNIFTYSTQTKSVLNSFLSADSCVPSNDPVIDSLLKIIIGKEKNSAEISRLIYNYMLDNYTILNEVRSGDVHPLDLLKKKKGDAYDFAIIYTALCRAAGIPSAPVSGILVELHDDQTSTKNHWWTEIYFEGFGWFPVDIALGAGLEFTQFNPVANTRNFYYGNLDNQHIAFSRGWHQIKQSFIDSKILYRPRTYALQSVWEEAGNETSSYSSLWSNPVVTGIY